MSDQKPQQKAAEIVQLWSRVAKAFGHQSGAWIKMLKIAATGANGITIRDLNGPEKARDGSWIRRATKAGLLECSTTPARGGRGGRAAILLKVTPIGLRALGLES
jgi:hypothetical protein